MTETKTLTAELSVSAFVPPDGLSEIAGRFGTIINNRPDGEEPAQASSAEIEEAARRLGLDYVHIPIVPGQIDEQQVERFARALSASPSPALAFCRTGARSTALWALSQAGSRSTADILATARAAGYDLSALRPRLEKRAQGA